MISVYRSSIDAERDTWVICLERNGSSPLSAAPGLTRVGFLSAV